MASSKEFVEFVLGQLVDAGDVSYKSMFGEYGIYLEGKYIAAVCDNTLFVKNTEGGRRVKPDYELGEPYPGATPMIIIEDLDNRELLAKLLRATWKEVPFPKPRKKKG